MTTNCRSVIYLKTGFCFASVIGQLKRKIQKKKKQEKAALENNGALITNTSMDCDFKLILKKFMTLLFHCSTKL